MSFSDYGRPKEFIAGSNYYPWNTRNLGMNIQLINVDQSPVSSTFGFYMGKITGPYSRSAQLLCVDNGYC